MLRKTKSDARWNQLTPEQQQTLDKWLFDDKLSYAKILPRAQKQLGYKGQMTSLKRYHKRRQQERLLTDMEQAGKDAAKLGQTNAKPGILSNANMQILNAHLFQVLRADPDMMKKLAPLIRAMVQNDYNEAIREIKEREHKMRREAMAFAKEKFEFDMMEKALRALPQLRELAEARKDPKTKKADQKERFKQLRRMMFGDEDEEEKKLQAPSPSTSAEATVDVQASEEPQNDELSNDQ